MNNKYFPPTFDKTSFHCPYCNVHANQEWYTTFCTRRAGQGFTQLVNLKVSHCSHCEKFTYWYGKDMVVPSDSPAPLPHTDMPVLLIDDFEEARKIVNLSPRGAAALLRLVLQKLMIELGESGKDINKDIGSLVQKGLPEIVQQALDIVRVIGNESVHPGELDIKDDKETALQLFELINFIIDDRISRKKKIASLFERLPENKRKGIEDRDKPRQE